MSTPNWPSLVLQGRAKAHGVPWSDAELKSVLNIATMPGLTMKEAAEYVRRGALTVEDVEKLVSADTKYEKEHGSKPIEALSRTELEARVKETQPHITKEAPTEVLRKLAKDDELKGAKTKAGDKKK